MVSLLQKCFILFQLVASFIVMRLHGWVGALYLIGLKNSPTIHCNCTRKNYSTACVQFVPTTYDFISGWFYQTAWNGR